MDKLGIDHNKARELVEKYISDPITRLHLRETEVFMRSLAKHFGENEEEWGIIGLLHDIDWELTKDDTQNHCVKCQEILREAGGSDYLVETIVSHGYGHPAIPSLLDKVRSTPVQYCLAAAETLTGIVVASALVQPDKKLASVKPESLAKKFKNKDFAAKCNRDVIMECEKAGIPIDQFLQIGLESIQSIAPELGL